MRTINKQLEIRWNGTDWIDETAYLEGASGDILLVGGSSSALIGTAQANSVRIRLNNSTKRFSAEYAAGALYAYIGSGKMRTVSVRLKIGVDEAATHMFSGAIDGWDEDTKAHITTLACLDGSHVAIDFATSTALYCNKRTDQYIAILLALIGDVSAVVDPGLYHLPFTWMDDESIYQELRAIVDAEMGRMFYDAAGILHIENAVHWLKHASSQHTFTVANFGSCLLGYDWQGFANDVRIEYTPRAASRTQQIWSGGEPYLLKPGEVRIVTCRLMNPAVSVADLVVGVDILASSSYGLDVNGQISWELISTTAQTLTYEITNNHATYGLFITHFVVRGIPVLGRLSRKVFALNQSSIDTYGRVVRTLPVNIYVQTEAHAQSIANMMCDRLSTPRLRYRLDSVPGVTGLTLGDRVTLVEAHSGSSLDCFITRITWSLVNKFTMTFELLESDLFQVDDYFLWGTSKYGNASQENHGHLWY